MEFGPPFYRSFSYDVLAAISGNDKGPGDLLTFAKTFGTVNRDRKNIRQ